jgi:hypothetical protein
MYSLKTIKTLVKYYWRKTKFFLFTKLLPKRYRLTLVPTVDVLHKHGKHLYSRGDWEYYTFCGLEFIVEEDDNVMQVYY